MKSVITVRNLTFRSKDRKIWNNPVSSEGVTMVFFIYKDEFIATYAAIVYKYSYVKLKKNYLNLSE